MARNDYDAIVVGGGHNALVSASYLARAGLTVLVLERLDHVGGAAVSTRPFAGLPARLSRYSYLVSLLPDEIMRDLSLDVTLASRRTSSFTPHLHTGAPGGLLVERTEGPATKASFRTLTGSDDDYAAWQQFYADVAELTAVVAPTLTQPLSRERDVAEQVSPTVWNDLVAQPLGRTITDRFADDTVRGVVATDALIGTFVGMDDASLAQNRCFLYHLMGNGTGEWRVPIGGMGAVTDALAKSARLAGATLITGAEVTSVATGAHGAEVRWRTATGERGATARTVLSGVAPWTMAGLLGDEATLPAKPAGSQLKLNLLLERLPTLRSGVDPRVAFSGTMHLSEGWGDLQLAYEEARAGTVPQHPPGEIYCHSLTDPSILEDLAPMGVHTLTYFGLHMPEELFTGPDGEDNRVTAVQRAIASIDEHLVGSIVDCIARDGEDKLCLEAKFPHDVEAELAMPGGHIFHGDLDWPWAPNRARLDTPAQRWGVATPHDVVLMCGSGARRGGAVSGLGGHNAAQAVLEAR
ncbi:phytoene desaturase family protein [Nocardioides jishulii]|uniref:Pyridine nucleotide-disulfide oxidoreductase domain-containing protein 2 n=1 Tax=Nocardioides jishulii TaxID=2575440 RepID=A0A4U2YML2_9ACTN|nr:NAD(P)/FAD-dependent oxidoreductase [Nocardioides jishulii]QCX29095.1 NAD(P)/FAD-dependent oxidoreductase [Nocardioides jishulii]TKI61845.1 NAD(P)/FAD-dependent oxidoreductase [Nocardioides jishulii]